MEKPTTKLSGQDRVILFCVATGIDHGSVHISLILTASALSVVHRELIIALAARYNLPTVYYRRVFAATGGLIHMGMILSTIFAPPATSIASAEAHLQRRPPPRSRRSVGQCFEADADPVCAENFVRLI
jgi:hypothetical protein